MEEIAAEFQLLEKYLISALERQATLEASVAEYWLTRGVVEF